MKKYLLATTLIVLAAATLGSSVTLGQTRVTLTLPNNATAPATPAAPTPTPVNVNTNIVTPCGSNCNMGYTPLEPIPGLTTGTGGPNDPYNLTSSTGFANLINAIFRVMISVGALIAVVSLTVGGVQYMVSGSAALKGKAIERVKASIWGIVLIAGIWLILNTINPNLLKFNFNPCPVGSATCASINYNVTNTNTPTSASNSTGLQNTTAVGPTTLGTATGDQMRQVNSELGLGNNVLGPGVASDKVLIYNPADNSSANNAAINSFTSWCETSSHYSVQPVYGGTFNAAGQNALVCVSN